MGSQVSLPLWVVVVMAILAILAALDRILIPSVRWALRRAHLLMVGTLSLAHATDCELICVAGKCNLDTQLRHTGTTGKSLLIFRNRVNPGNRKYSAFVLAQIIGITPPVSPD